MHPTARATSARRLTGSIVLGYPYRLMDSTEQQQAVLPQQLPGDATYDLSAVPTLALYAEIGKRRRALRKSASGNSATPTRCPVCGDMRQSKRQARAHCKRKKHQHVSVITVND